MNELINVEEKKLIDYFSTGGLKVVLEDIKKLATNFESDISTAKGRAAITAQASKVQKSRKYLEDLRLSIVSDWTKKTKAVNAEGKIAKDFLIDLQSEIRKPLTEWEEVEKKRVAELELRMVSLRAFLTPSYDLSSDDLSTHLEQLKSTSIDDWEEYKDEAIRVKAEAIEIHTSAIKKAIEQEREKAELEQLRKDKEIRDQKDREEKIAREAKESAERKAQEEMRIQAEKVEREKKESLEREKKIEQEKIDAEKRAIELEKKIIQEKKEAEEKAANEKIEAEKREALAIQKAKIEEQERIKEEEEAKRKLEVERKNNLNHQMRVKNEVLTDLVSTLDISELTAKSIIEVIVNGEIRNIKLIY